MSQVQVRRTHIVIVDVMVGVCLLIDSKVVAERGSFLGFSPVEGQMGHIFNDSEVVQCPYNVRYIPETTTTLYRRTGLRGVT